jgi:hypothetical protein
MMSTHLQATASRLRTAIECGTGASYEIADLVIAMGGSTQVLVQNAGQPHIVTAYLVALLLTQPEAA